jgi:hypothetical protein
MADYLVINFINNLLCTSKTGTIVDQIDLQVAAPETFLSSAQITLSTNFGLTSKHIAMKFLASGSGSFQIIKLQSTAPVVVVYADFWNIGDVDLKFGSDDGDLRLLIAGTSATRVVAYNNFVPVPPTSGGGATAAQIWNEYRTQSQANNTIDMPVYKILK